MRNELKDLAEKKSSWIMNNLLEVLVSSIAVYFYEQARQNMAHLIKILSDTTHQNV